MKFHLRSLLVLVTLAAIGIAITLSILNHRKQLREHRMAFLSIGESVSALDTAMQEHILSIDSVAATLKESNPVDPPMALGLGITGESLSVGACKFQRTFHFSWQLPNGSRCDGIRITVDAKLDENALDDHIVRLTYESNDLNKEVASWIDDHLAHHEHVQIEHNPTTPQRVESAANSSIEEANLGWSVHGGVR